MTSLWPKKQQLSSLYTCKILLNYWRLLFYSSILLCQIPLLETFFLETGAERNPKSDFMNVSNERKMWLQTKSCHKKTLNHKVSTSWHSMSWNLGLCRNGTTSASAPSLLLAHHVIYWGTTALDAKQAAAQNWHRWGRKESADVVLRHFLISYRCSNVQEYETFFCKFKRTLAKWAIKSVKGFQKSSTLISHILRKNFTHKQHISMKSLCISVSQTNVNEKFLKKQFIDWCQLYYKH